MRLLNICVIAVLVFAAVYVYDIKYESTLRAERVAKLRNDIRHERDAIAGLRAEWAQLGNPRRIQSLARRHLSLKPIDATQFDGFDRLPERPPQLGPLGKDDPISAKLDDFDSPEILTGSVSAPAADGR
jgi:cell division protein FtsL